MYYEILFFIKDFRRLCCPVGSHGIEWDGIGQYKRRPFLSSFQNRCGTSTTRATTADLGEPKICNAESFRGEPWVRVFDNAYTSTLTQVPFLQTVTEEIPSSSKSVVVALVVLALHRCFQMLPKNKFMEYSSENYFAETTSNTLTIG
jgi:hypothetical protein